MISSIVIAWIWVVLWSALITATLWVIIDYSIVQFVLLSWNRVMTKQLPGSVHEKDCQCWLCNPEPAKPSKPENVGILVPSRYLDRNIWGDK